MRRWLGVLVATAAGSLWLCAGGCMTNFGIGEVIADREAGRQRCLVDSQPEGALVWLNGRQASNKTPVSVTRPMHDGRGDRYEFVVRKPGFEVATRQINGRFPSHVHFELTPQPQASPVLTEISACDLAGLPEVAEPLTLAVLDFHVPEDQATPQTGTALADFCREAIRESGRYRLVDRAHMRAILTEEDFAASVNCDSTRCLVDFGRKLAARYLVHGRVTRVEQTRVLTLALVDVQTTEVVALRNIKTPGSFEELLDLTPAITCQLLYDALNPPAAANRAQLPPIDT